MTFVPKLGAWPLAIPNGFITQLSAGERGPLMASVVFPHLNLHGRAPNEEVATGPAAGRRKVSMVGVGRVAIVEDDVDPFLLGTSVTYYKTNPSLLSNRYLFWLFCSPIFQDQLEAIMGQTTRNQVPITRQAYIELPIASISEQHEIVRRIDTALGWITRFNSETTKARTLVNHLNQAILAKAFRGDLVPQDPSDEPASVLLERIRAGREASITLHGRNGKGKAPATASGSKQRTRRKK